MGCHGVRWDDGLGLAMTSIYQVDDDDEKKIFRKDRKGNYYEVGNEDDDFADNND
jgi:hypothetical protein